MPEASFEARNTTVAATSSSRFTAPSYWLDKSTGTAYQVQVQYPNYRMNSTAQLEAVPVSSGPNGETHLLGEVATWKRTTVPGEYDRLNQQRYITITANIQQKDKGATYAKVRNIIAGAERRILLAAGGPWWSAAPTISPRHRLHGLHGRS